MKEGFTLAELLITLGIIGVVAALTIPNLIANAKGKQFSAAFKKGVSTLNQMVRLNKANYDFDFSEAIGFYEANSKGLACDEKSNPENDNTICGMVNANLKGVTFIRYDIMPDKEGTRLKVDPDYPDDPPYYSIKVHESNSGSSPMVDTMQTKYLLADGSIVMLPDLMGDNGTSCHLPNDTTLRDNLLDASGDNGTIIFDCIGYIDVNGANLPNEEVACSKGTTSYDLNEPCIVDNKHVKDVFPVVFYDATVAPATNAADYVLKHSK